MDTYQITMRHSPEDSNLIFVGRIPLFSWRKLQKTSILATENLKYY
jgi:hypothetical protein